MAAKGKRLPSNPAINKTKKLPDFPKVKDSAPSAQKIPTYSLFENAIKTLYAQGKVSTPNSLYRDINSTGLAPKRLEYQLAGVDEKIAEWKELYGENGPIPRDELLQFATENNAKTNIRQRVQRPDPRERANKIKNVDQDMTQISSGSPYSDPNDEADAWFEWDERREERLEAELDDVRENMGLDADSADEVEERRIQGLDDEPWMKEYKDFNKEAGVDTDELVAWANKHPDDIPAHFEYPKHPDADTEAFINSGENGEDPEPGTANWNKKMNPPPSRHPDGTLMTEQEIRDIRREKGIVDTFARPNVGPWTSFRQAPTRGDPTSDLGSPATARKQARWPEYTYNEASLLRRSTEYDDELTAKNKARLDATADWVTRQSELPDAMENDPPRAAPTGALHNIAAEGNAAQRLAEVQEQFAYNQGVATEGMKQELEKLKLILGENARMTPRGTNYQEHVFSSRPRVPYDDVPVEKLAEQGKLGPAAMQKGVLDQLLAPSGNEEFYHKGYDKGFRINKSGPRYGLGWESEGSAGTEWHPLAPYTMPEKADQTLSQARKRDGSNTFLDETDPHHNPHYRATEIPANPEVEGDRGFYELHNMQGPSQSTRRGDLAKAKPKDLIPSMAFNIDPDVQRVAQNDFLRNFLSSGRPALIPHGKSVNIAEGMPIPAGNKKYGMAGSDEKPELIRSLMNSLSAEGVKPDQMTYGPAPGKYAGTHNLFEVSPDAIAYLMKHGIRALTVGGLTGAGAAAMDQTPEQQVGY